MEKERIAELFMKGIDCSHRNDFTQIPNGCPLDLRFDAAALASPSGVAMLEGLLKSFIGLGGYYLQVDAVSREMLVDAKAHPERYPNLAVRISGWSARFATLETAWQAIVLRWIVAGCYINTCYTVQIANCK